MTPSTPEHPEHRIGEWVLELLEGSTDQSYWEWVRTQLEMHAAEPA